MSVMVLSHLLVSADIAFLLDLGFPPVDVVSEATD